MNGPPAPTPQPSDHHSLAPRSGVSSGRWFAEAVVILASVAMGFAASEFGQYRQEQGLARTVIRQLREEVEQNEAALAARVVTQRAWQKALASPDAKFAEKSAFDTLILVRPEGSGSIGVPLKSAAWAMAVSTGALRLLGHDVASALSEIYSLQNAMTEYHNRIVSAALYVPTAFDPAVNVVSTRLLSAVMGEVVGNEEALRDLYRRHLPLLRRSSDE
jgi:hypothetical protein